MINVEKIFFKPDIGLSYFRHRPYDAVPYSLDRLTEDTGVETREKPWGWENVEGLIMESEFWCY